MALETPNRVHASAVVLAQNMFDPPNETLEFRNNVGFSSIAFVDPADTPIGVVLKLIQEVTNDEGSVYLGSDPNGILDGGNGNAAWITPSHLEAPEPLLNALDSNQVVVSQFLPKETSFRFNVIVFAAMTEVEPIAGEPLAP